MYKDKGIVSIKKIEKCFLWENVQWYSISEEKFSMGEI